VTTAETPTTFFTAKNDANKQKNDKMAEFIYKFCEN
jgi:hypothetical protein